MALPMDQDGGTRFRTASLCMLAALSRLTPDCLRTAFRF